MVQHAASDGSVFSYGDARFVGTMGGQARNKPMDAVGEHCGPQILQRDIAEVVLVGDGNRPTPATPECWN
ncbi:hypothetical protein Afe04nite_20180 [Asanoa ferruginea]|nr:hypothetical protein Afe04nite_20180 [Asanoa ferruginea]